MALRPKLGRAAIPLFLVLPAAVALLVGVPELAAWLPGQMAR